MVGSAVRVTLVRTVAAAQTVVITLYDQAEAAFVPLSTVGGVGFVFVLSAAVVVTAGETAADEVVLGALDVVIAVVVVVVVVLVVHIEPAVQAELPEVAAELLAPAAVLQAVAVVVVVVVTVVVVGRAWPSE